MAQVNIVQNITGGFSESDTRLANLSDTLNMYVETQSTGSSTTSMLRSIQGTSLLHKISDRTCRGIIECARDVNGEPVLFAVFADELYCITNDNSIYLISKGTINNLDTPVSMCETGGEGSANPHLIVVDGSNVIAVATNLQYDDMKNDVRSIALPYRVVQPDKEKPSVRITPTHCAYCYNYLIVNDAGTDAFYTSYQYPFERKAGPSEPVDYDIFMISGRRAVEAGYKDYGFVTYSEWSPDNTVALCSNATLLYTFGPKSTQIFTYNNNVDAPFVSPTNAANGIGIKAVHSLAMVGDYVFYLGSSAIGENGVYFWKGNQMTKVSTADIERYISALPNTVDAKGQCWTENGHMFYAISFVNGDTTLVYDITENLWHRRSTKDAKNNKQHSWRNLFATLHNGKLMFGTTDGAIVYLNNKKFDEYDGRPIIRLRRSGMLMNNYQDYCVDGLKLICNSGDFVNPNLVPRIMMRYNDNGGAWSNQEIGLLGRQGQYGYEVEWFNLGLHNVMCIEFSCSDPINFCILNGKIQYSLIDSF